MNRKAFQELLQRYAEGNCTKEDLQLIDQLYDLLKDRNIAELSTVDFERIENEVWAGIQGKAQIQKVPDQPKPIKKLFWWFLAAAVIVGVVLITFISVDKNKTQNPLLAIGAEHEVNNIVKQNNTRQPLDVWLEDSSMVVLEPGAGISYPASFDKGKRELTLMGNAFFKIARDASRPFFVYSGDVVTSVLGTSFTILSDEKDHRITVSVKEGKVAVYEKLGEAQSPKKSHSKNGVILTPNQQTTWLEDKKYFVTTLVEHPKPLLPLELTKLSPAANPFDFEESLLSEVLEVLEKRYAIEIQVENAAINRCSFTGDISEMELFDKLELICRSTGTTYEVKGTSILINGKGCD